MKTLLLALLLVWLALFSSCTRERIMTNRAKKYQGELYDIFKKIYAQYDKSGYFYGKYLDSLYAYNPELSIVKRKLTCHVISFRYGEYSYNDPFYGDSVIIFERISFFRLLGVNHYLMIDMRQKPRDELFFNGRSVRLIGRRSFYKFSSRFYYARDRYIDTFEF